MRYLYLLYIILLSPLALSAQCYPDRHNTSWSDAWISCEKSRNPNTNRGNSHWIAYDFGSVYRLGTMKMWNLNIPEELVSGVRSFTIDYSLDGQLWTELGTYTLSMATGKSIYEGEEITDWEGKQARYVILSPIDNYGGPCVGISEVRFGLDSNTDVVTTTNQENAPSFTIQTYPNPYVDRFTLQIESKNQGEVHYSISNILGQVVMQQSFDPNISTQVEVNTSHLPAGNYVIKVVQDDGILSKSIVQIPLR